MTELKSQKKDVLHYVIGIIFLISAVVMFIKYQNLYACMIGGALFLMNLLQVSRMKKASASWRKVAMLILALVVLVALVLMFI
jgi:hypothetical protein